MYESKVSQRIISLVGFHLDIRRPRFLKGDGVLDEEFFIDVFDDAWEKGVITKEERGEVWNYTNNVFRGESREDQSVAYAAVRVAMTVEDRHVNQAAFRAGVMRRVTGERVVPAVIAARIGDTQRQLASELGVALIHVSFEDVKMIEPLEI